MAVCGSSQEDGVSADVADVHVRWGEGSAEVAAPVTDNALLVIRPGCQSFDPGTNPSAHGLHPGRPA